MKLRLAFTAIVYTAVLVVGGLLVTGSLKVGPFGGGTEQALALESADSGNSTLLCYGCYHQNTVTVRVTVTFQPNYNPCSWGCYQNYNNYNYNPCSWGCHQNYNNYNPCGWGCNNYNNYNYNSCSWGCGNQYYYPQQVVYHQPAVRHYNPCRCGY